MTHHHDRVAVVTGASSGIGEATARALARGGHRVALLARRFDRIERLAEELDNGSIAITADVTDRDSLVAAAARVQDELGATDVLVNNAGIMLLGPFDSDQRNDYRAMLEVNLLGAITATEVFLAHSAPAPTNAEATSSTSPPSPAAPHAPATASTPPPSGASTAGPRRSGRSCCPTSG